MVKNFNEIVPFIAKWLYFDLFLSQNFHLLHICLLRPCWLALLLKNTVLSFMRSTADDVRYFWQCVPDYSLLTPNIRKVFPRGKDPYPTTRRVAQMKIQVAL